jgi:hypothetical protein
MVGFRSTRGLYQTAPQRVFAGGLMASLSCAASYERAYRFRDAALIDEKKEISVAPFRIFIAH